jgi:PhnB protein
MKTQIQVWQVLERRRGSMSNGVSRRQFSASVFGAVALAALPIPSIADVKIAKTGGDKMTTLTPYLLLDGNCREAMEFYKVCFGGELSVTKVKDSPAKDHMPAFQHEKVLNAHLKSSNVDISASDWLRPDRTRISGNTACLYLSGGTFEELKILFDKLSEGADVTDPLSQQFFGAYGALNDKFGVRWMFHANKKA